MREMRKQNKSGNHFFFRKNRNLLVNEPYEFGIKMIQKICSTIWYTCFQILKLKDKYSFFVTW